MMKRVLVRIMFSARVILVVGLLALLQQQFAVAYLPRTTSSYQDQARAPFVTTSSYQQSAIPQSLLSSSALIHSLEEYFQVRFSQKFS